jgi:hypothetical protein
MIYGNWIYNHLVQSVPFTTKVVSSNLVHGEVYSIPYYMIVCQLHATGRWFSAGTPVSFTNKTDPPRYNWNIAKSGVKHHNPKPHIFDVKQLIKQYILAFH